MRILEQGQAVLVRSPAKLNLLLAIRGRRSDGFHELETLMIKVSLFDTLRFAARTDQAITLKIESTATTGRPPIPTDSRNLVVRAAELLQRQAGIRFGADVVLVKSIPAEAGLAGGSGNAAATLLGLNRLWKLGLDRETLTTLAAQLGSDVPFFLGGATAAIARGRGERIESTPVRGPLHVVIVKPPFGLSTAEVYRTFADEGQPSDRSAGPLATALASGRITDVSRHLCNDLAQSAERLRPELRSLRQRLEKECRFGGLMTGSGSACFGLCGSAREAMTVAARLRAARIGQVFAATSA